MTASTATSVLRRRPLPVLIPASRCGRVRHEPRSPTPCPTPGTVLAEPPRWRQGRPAGRPRGVRPYAGRVPNRPVTPRVDPLGGPRCAVERGDEVDVQLSLIVAGLLIGVVVGMTGMGGGALMTP